MNGTKNEPQSQGQTSDLARILGFVGELLSTASDPAARRRARDFSREATLTPDVLVVLLLFMAADGNRRGYRHLLDAFWDECATHDVPLPTAEPVSASAFCQARGKLSSNVLRKVLHEASRKLESTFRGPSRWNGRRVLAVDGCKVNLQRSPDLDFSFGRPEGGHVPQATVSALVNVMSGAPNDIVIDRYGACERQMLLEHLQALRPGDVLVLDRGYPSHEVLRILLDSGVDFLVRVPATNTFEAIETFRTSGANDCRVIIPPAKDTRRGAQPIALRAVRLKNPSGEESFYLTSLPRSQFDRKEIAELYQLRWRAEELFKLEKSVCLDQRQFHAKSELGVRQEILAQAIYVVVARFLQAASARHVGAEYQELSVKSAVLALADYLTRLCLSDPVRAVQVLPRLMERIARTRDRRRPGRSCPRRSFKPGPRWGPSGRRGA
jgi:Transposase DDE domain